MLLLGVANFWGFSSPNGFTKCASIVSVQELPKADWGEASYYIDVREVVGSIPAPTSDVPDRTFVDPDLRVQYVFGEGKGDCAQRSRALARELQGRSIPYRMVWIMHGSETRAGNGHTVVECAIQLSDYKGAAIVDLLEGGVPFGPRGPIKLEDLLAHKPFPGDLIRPLTSWANQDSPYYGQFLEDSAIGISTSDEVNRYSDAMAAWYVDTGYPRFEKLFYILGAMVFGKYPNVYMTPTEVARFDPWFRFEIFLARTLVWTIRVLLVMGAAHLLVILWNWSKRPPTPVRA
ncbi:MAG: hypothetical protein FJ260_09650 [Planctomycetes bacterium]|nr:hypothetical protein [Planctomycetota bacterium]